MRTARYSSESEVVVNDKVLLEQFCACDGVRYRAPNAATQQIGCFLACGISDIAFCDDTVVAFLKRIGAV